MEVVMKRKSNRFVFTCVMISAVLVMSTCKDDTPPENNSPKPGKRNYVWMVDTLAYPGSFQTTMRDIWASSPTNVYVVGHNDRAGMGVMFHYDGQRWEPVRLLTREGGTIQQGFDLAAIHGFSPNDIYAVGQFIYDNPNPPPNFLDSSLIIHFDGMQWREEQLPWRGRQLIGVGPTGATSVGAGGVNGISYVREGGSWRAVQSDTTFWFADFAFDESGVFGTAYFLRPALPEQNFFLRWSGSSWSVVDSFSLGLVPPRFGGYALQNIKGTLYSVGLGVFRKDGTSWAKILDSSPEGMLGFYGTRREHLFAVGTSASIFHFNGTDWHKYSEFETIGTLCSGVWCNESEVFVVAEDGYKTFIYHGK